MIVRLECAICGLGIGRLTSLPVTERTVRHWVRETAKSRGWKYAGRKWLCPECEAERVALILKEAAK